MLYSSSFFATMHSKKIYGEKMKSDFVFWFTCTGVLEFDFTSQSANRFRLSPLICEFGLMKDTSKSSNYSNIG